MAHVHRDVDGGAPSPSASAAGPPASARCATTHKEAAWDTAKLLAAGGVAGSFSKTCTAPLARLTILYQVRRSARKGAEEDEGGVLTSVAQVQGMQDTRMAKPRLHMGELLARIVREEGARALWKGNGVTIVHRFPYAAVNFFAYEKFTRMLTNHDEDFDGPPPGGYGLAGRRLLAGGAAGATACSVTYPLDLIRTRLAVQRGKGYYKGMAHAFGRILGDEGVRGLYRGLAATLVGVAPCIAINFATYETLRAKWMHAHPEFNAPTVGVSLAAGSMAGMVSSTATFPLDLLRRRLQLEGAGGQKRRYNGYFHAFRTLIQHEGFRGLYAGIIPEYVKVIPGVAISFYTYEMAKRMFNCEQGHIR